MFQINFHEESRERKKANIYRRRQTIKSSKFMVCPEIDEFIKYCDKRIFSNSSNHTETESNNRYFECITDLDFMKSWTKLTTLQKEIKMKEFINNDLEWKKKVDKKSIENNKLDLVDQCVKLIKKDKIKKKHVTYSDEEGKLLDLHFVTLNKENLWVVDESLLD